MVLSTVPNLSTEEMFAKLTANPTRGTLIVAGGERGMYMGGGGRALFGGGGLRVLGAGEDPLPEGPAEEDPLEDLTATNVHCEKDQRFR